MSGSLIVVLLLTVLMCLLSICASETDSLHDDVAFSAQIWQPLVLCCSARYRLHRADAAVPEHHVLWGKSVLAADT